MWLNRARTLHTRLETGLGHPLLQGLLLLSVRLWLAKTFFLSGLTKIGNMETTYALFADEYKVPVLPPEVAALLATATELSLPVLLVAGWLTRASAFGLLMMTLVIELLVYPGTTEHIYWIFLCLTLIVFGSGQFGVDAFFKASGNPPLRKAL